MKSRAVRALGYDPKQRLLDVMYPEGLYRYLDVPPQQHSALMAAESIGRYVNEHIKPKYRYEKLN